jgi:site-specific DNA recombinase
MIYSNVTQRAAFLYTRVSTEEQAIYGNSLKIQQDVLRQYCQLRDIKIEREFIEEYSAKTFKRPEWRKLMAAIENSKTRPNVVLFTRWDRFSRNTGEAYYVIKCLKSFGVDAQAIEQPLDLSVPENKMMFAFYLAIPEVENDRRGLNVRNGIRKAKECGKWVGPAPIGYKNYTYPDGTKAIIKKEPEASRQVFMKLKCGTHTISNVYHEAVNQGLNCSKSNFWNLIKNPVYAGKMKWKEDGKRVMTTYGRHIGIISEDVFEKVQEIFKREVGVYCIGYSPNMPFRGFMQCPHCGRILTGSASGGRSRKYFYYHCSQGCKYRIRAVIVFEWFMEQLSKLQLSDQCFDMYLDALNELSTSKHRNIASQKLRALKSIDRFFEQMAKAKELMLNSSIMFEASCEIKKDCEAKIKALGAVVDLCAQAEYKLVSKGDIRSQKIIQLYKFFCDLDDEHRISFLNCFLLRPAIWEDRNQQSIFKLPVDILFKNKGGIGDNLYDKNSASSIRSLFRELAQLQLSVEQNDFLI